MNIIQYFHWKEFSDIWRSKPDHFRSKKLKHVTKGIIQTPLEQLQA